MWARGACAARLGVPPPCLPVRQVSSRLEERGMEIQRWVDHAQWLVRHELSAQGRLIETLRQAATGGCGP